MFKLLKKETKTKFYSIEKDLVIVKDTDKDYYNVSTQDYSFTIEKKCAGRTPFYWNDLMVFSSSNNKKTVFFKNSKEFKKENHFSFAKMEKYLITSLKTESERSIIFLDQNFNIAFKKDFIIGGSAYSNHTLFACSEFITSDKLNIFQLSDDMFKFDTVDISHNTWENLEGKKHQGEIIQIIGQWNNELIVFIGRFRIVSFDLDTFEELWRIDDFLGDISSNPIFDYTFPSAVANWKLSAEENKAYLFIQNLFYILDLETKKSALIKDFHNDNEKWYFSKTRFYDDYITFSGATRPAMFTMFIGVIDRKTNKVIWSAESQTDFFTEAPQLKDNKLYALNNDKTLYIYEREQSQPTQKNKSFLSA